MRKRTLQGVMRLCRSAPRPCMPASMPCTLRLPLCTGSDTGGHTHTHQLTCHMDAAGCTEIQTVPRCQRTASLPPLGSANSSSNTLSREAVSSASQQGPVLGNCLACFPRLFFRAGGDGAAGHCRNVLSSSSLGWATGAVSASKAFLDLVTLISACADLV